MKFLLLMSDPTTNETQYIVDVIGHDFAWKCALDVMDCELRKILKPDVVDLMVMVQHLINPQDNETRYRGVFKIA